MGAAEVLANMIHNHTKSDLFSIRTENNYPLEYNELADYAKDEQDNNVLPVLTSHIDNLDQYSTIIVVFPDWWYTMPQAVYSFFDEYDFSGKTIIPCSTHAGSGLAGSPKTIRELEPNATVIDDGFTVAASRVTNAEDDVIAWVEKHELNEGGQHNE
ncbi:MAG: NAD(P)H-dependent oxidoreductase [Ruminococcus sp.]|nr:NAD(P)H-dependent oxidoreductase [Ruminococcus sp.]